ncbi:MAG: glycine cleavage system protein H [Bacteroidetes bacterium GWF2_41_61]|jgi:glycine cleavage system H protein|nr:MAG: glycine cleavage system protein H [Bacteroidetes bacterium GWE2_40_15]OFY29985.1 MAG: glycine cleavage system protein H [Bacteroidetes bacterium GWF2_41_61]OFY90630.1 MAG: glycine cleavage system protein H [Bacteroidetes bacterium RIFOXYA12_FULL_40_10]PKP07257.1 MAG: glycine cleavage system protein H [Bacteroidetes bacterium HGW-Bacteroidetes-5]HBG24933.1 glycine cleavage system protein GcvH [Rikenellaceae bacterium]
MNIPANLKYSPDHEWIKIEGNIATVGITDFAQGQLGDVVFVDIPSEGETLDKSDVFGAIEAVKTVADAFMPVSGKIIEINANLESSPESVNKDPYQEGWMIKIEMSNPSEADSLLDAEAYKALL